MTTTILEHQQRMSQSILWKLQQEAYTQFGPQAWSHKGVPFYVTSNPYTVRQYAQVVLGYLRDSIKNNINSEHPVYILDLGAGTGRFGYLFICILIDLLKSSPELQKIKFCYVMTDIAEKNITFWQQHPYLQPFVQEGLLDFAFYNAYQKEPLHLIERNVTLSKEILANPLVLIANYFFDTIPQDLFRVQNGVLEEGRISIAIDKKEIEGSLTPNNPNIIPHMKCTYDFIPTSSPNYYSDNALNNILQQYTQEFSQATFLFPAGGFASLHYFAKLSGNRFFLIAGDQGVSTQEQIAKWGEPSIARHGTFSIAVNYDAIAKYFRNQNGSALLTTFPDTQFVVIAATPSSTIPETDSAFRSHIDYFEPCDFWRLINYTEEGWKNPPLEFIFLLLKWGNWDPMVFNDYFPTIREQLPKATAAVKKQFVDAIHKVWSHFYPIAEEEGAFIMNLGVLLFELGNYAEALSFYNQAMKWMGHNPQLLQNMAVCYNAFTNTQRS